ncbi:MAG: hypothetical protein NC393_05905, partial [Clostridium sp.]|nr:hypothetical protein [Clostridium sp.]
VDFEHNFPELDYYIRRENTDIYRYVKTHECTNFEGYRNAPVGGDIVTLFSRHGYTNVEVGIAGEKEEIYEAMKAIKKILEDADFDMYVTFYELSSNTSGEYDFYSFENDVLVYEPFENGFWGDILEEEMEEKLNE